MQRIACFDHRRTRGVLVDMITDVRDISNSIGCAARILIVSDLAGQARNIESVTADPATVGSSNGVSLAPRGSCDQSSLLNLK